MQSGRASYDVTLSLISGDPQEVGLTQIWLYDDGTTDRGSTFYRTPPTSFEYYFETDCSWSPGIYTFMLEGEGGGIIRRSQEITLEVRPIPSCGPVEEFDFGVSVTPSYQSVTQGGKASYSVDVSLISGEPQPVTLTSIMLNDDGTTTRGSPTQLTPPDSIGLNFTTDCSWSPGKYRFSIEGESGELVRRSQQITLEVKPSPACIVEEEFDFKMELVGSSYAVVSPGDDAQFKIKVSKISGKPEPVAMAIGGPDIFDLVEKDRTDWFFDGTKDKKDTPNPDFTTELVIKTTPDTLPDTYRLEIRGASARMSHSISITLEVKEVEKKLVIYGKVAVADEGKHPLPNSIVVLADSDEMKKSSSGKLLELSKSKPSFIDITKTDENGEYKFKPLEWKKDKLPKLVVISLLWYYGDNFAVTGSKELEGRLVPVYQALCADSTGSSCVNWKESNTGGKLYEAKVDFVYGDQSKTSAHAALMNLDSDSWTKPAALDYRTFMKDAGTVYYYSYKAMRYFEDMGKKIGGVTLKPVSIQIRNTIHDDCVDDPDNAFYHDAITTPFGNLGNKLPPITAAGGGIVLCDLASSADDPGIPDNREYHELSHYFHYQMYDPYDGQISVNHAGYNNTTTNDSFIEGFAEFNSMLISEYYGDPLPSLYKVGGTSTNLELDYRVWGTAKIKDGRVEIKNPDDEEYAVAGILWDLHDNNNDKGSIASEVYPQSADTVSLSAEKMLGIIKNGKSLNLLDLYLDFVTEADMKAVYMIFVNHGAFSDTVKRNLAHDAKESVGFTGSSSDPTREVRNSPKPKLPGSYIVSNYDATFTIDIIFEEPYEYYNFSYQIDMTAGERSYFEMPPPYYPSKAVFSQISGEKTIVPEAIVIESEEYWDYIDSEPEDDATFKTIPAKEVTELGLYEGQWVKYSFNKIDITTEATDPALAESMKEAFLTGMASGMGLEGATIYDIEWVKTTVKEISGTKYVTVDTVRTKDGREAQKENTYDLGENCGNAVPVTIVKGDIVKCDETEALVEGITTRQIAGQNREVFELTSTSKQVDQVTGTAQEMNARVFFDTNTGIMLEAYTAMSITGSDVSFNIEINILAFELDTQELNDKGYDLSKLGKYEESITYFDKALKMDPKNVYALSNTAFVLDKLSRYEEALPYLDKALEVEPKNVFALTEEGYALESLGKYEDALQSYSKVLEAEPDNAYALEHKQMMLDKLATTTGGGGCLIATAAFGSELTPQVQFLRDFRDQRILSTVAGSSFMNVFNTWYYSFSPYVADYERQQPWLQQTVKTLIYPLLGILQISEKGYALIDGEYGALAAGAIASSMIGALYFAPLALSVRHVRNNRFNYKLAGSMILVVFAAVVGSTVAGNGLTLMASTSLFVLTVLSVSAVLSAKLFAAVVKRLREYTNR